MSERTATTGLAAGTFTSPVGELLVACSPAGVARVDFGRPLPPSAAAPAAVPDAARELLAEALRQLAGYFAGRRRDFTLPVDWTGVAQTQQRVLAALIEAARYGQTITYGELAGRAGLPDSADHAGQRAAGRPGPSGSAASAGNPVSGGQAAPPDEYRPPARVVAQVMGANRCPVIVPCHRVVAGNGLGGYSGGAGVEIKRWLLILEGALPPTLDWDPAGPALP
jgi:methylated-DNA-[protein]-cysteine S-methyltransferase